MKAYFVKIKILSDTLIRTYIPRSRLRSYRARPS